MRDGRHTAMYGIAASVLIIASLTIQAVVIATSGLGPDPSPAEIDAWKVSHRGALAAVGAPLVLSLPALFLFVAGLRHHMGGAWLATAGAWLLRIGGVAVASFGVSAMAGYIDPPQLIVSNLTDALVGMGLLVLGSVEWARRTAHRAVSGLGIVQGMILFALAPTPAADPHLAQLVLLIWLLVRGVHLRWNARTVHDGAPRPQTL